MPVGFGCESRSQKRARLNFDKNACTIANGNRIILLLYHRPRVKRAMSCKRLYTWVAQEAGTPRFSSYSVKVKRKSKAVLDLIHTDLCEVMTTATSGSCRCFLSLIDSRDVRDLYNQAVHDGLHFMKTNNGVWKLMTCLVGVKLFKTRWVFWLKEDETGHSVRHGTWLVIKGVL